MSVDTKMILFGAPGPQEVAAAIRESFGLEAEVRDTSVEDMFIVMFPEPSGAKEGRRLHVFPDCQSIDTEHVYAGRHTYCTFGAWGSSIRIAEALASRFGGYVLDRDDKDDWRLIEAADSENAAPHAPLDALKIELEKAVGAKDAVVLAALAADEGKLVRIMAAYEAYKAAKAKEAAVPRDAGDVSEGPGIRP